MSLEVYPTVYNREHLQPDTIKAVEKYEATLADVRSLRGMAVHESTAIINRALVGASGKSAAIESATAMARAAQEAETMRKAADILELSALPLMMDAWPLMQRDYKQARAKVLDELEQHRQSLEETANGLGYSGATRHRFFANDTTAQALKAKANELLSLSNGALHNEATRARNAELMQALQGL